MEQISARVVWEKVAVKKFEVVRQSLEAKVGRIAGDYLELVGDRSFSEEVFIDYDCVGGVTGSVLIVAVAVKIGSNTFLGFRGRAGMDFPSLNHFNGIRLGEVESFE